MFRALASYNITLEPRVPNPSNRAFTAQSIIDGRRFSGRFGEHVQSECNVLPVIMGTDAMLEYLFRSNCDMRVAETPAGITLIIIYTSVGDVPYTDILQFPLTRVLASAKSVEEATALEDRIASLEHLVAGLRADLRR